MVFQGAFACTTDGTAHIKPHSPTNTHDRVSRRSSHRVRQSSIQPPQGDAQSQFLRALPLWLERAVFIHDHEITADGLQLEDQLKESIRLSRVWPPPSSGGREPIGKRHRAGTKLARDARSRADVFAPKSVTDNPVIWPHLQIERLLTGQILCVRHERERVDLGGSNCGFNRRMT